MVADSASTAGESNATVKRFTVRSSPPEAGRAVLTSRPYALPGDKFATHEPSIFDMASLKQLKPAVDRFEHGWEAPRVRWKSDGRHFAYQQVDRGHQRFRVILVDAHTGEARNLIDEKSDTFIWTAHTENVRLQFVNWLEKTDEVIYVSERDGWRHLYLIDATDGKLKNQIKGEYVRGIDRMIGAPPGLVQRRWPPSQPDPYFIHYYRVNFDGTGFDD